jgi:hypothetical protein
MLELPTMPELLENDGLRCHNLIRLFEAASWSAESCHRHLCSSENHIIGFLSPSKRTIGRWRENDDKITGPIAP